MNMSENITRNTNTDIHKDEKLYIQIRVLIRM